MIGLSNKLVKLNITASMCKATICGNEKEEYAKEDRLTIERMNGTVDAKVPYSSTFH